MINGKVVDLEHHREPRAADPGHPERHQVTSYLPSPTVGVFHLGPLPIRMYALCILVGIVRGGVAHRPPARPPWGGAGPGPRRRGVGRAVRHRRRPALPRHHHAGPVLGRGRPPGRRPEDLERRPRHLGRHRARRARRLHRLPALRHQLPRPSSTPRCPGSRSRRPSAGSATGSTTSSTAARRPCRGASRSTSGTSPRGVPCSTRPGNPVLLGRLPADLPLRVGLPRRARHAAARRRQAPLAGARAS